MAIPADELERLIFNYEVPIRLTQDSPMPPDVWTRLGAAHDGPVDLLLVPHRDSSAGALASELRKRLARFDAGHPRRVAYTGTVVAVQMTLGEVVWVALPLTKWWHSKLLAGHHLVVEQVQAMARGLDMTESDEPPFPEPGAGAARDDDPPLPGRGPGPVVDDGPPYRVRIARQLPWLVGLAGRIAWEAKHEGAPEAPTPEALAQALLDVRPEIDEHVGPPPLLWAINRNRAVRSALWRSRQAVKADAAGRMFEPDIADLAWAVIDSGIDARHPAFRWRDPDGKLLELPEKKSFENVTKVVRTYDFTRLRPAVEGSLEPRPEGAKRRRRPSGVSDELHKALQTGRAVDWQLVEPLIRVPHDAASYSPPGDPHGTHVSGILAGDWRPTDGKTAPEHPLQGVCPGLELFDLRVLDGEGRGEEFAVLAALAFVRWLNTQSDRRQIHGVNLSISLDHDILNSACGRSPVCEEAERVHHSGVVVVAAAGNEGQCDFSHAGRTTSGYRTVSITDPGNAASIITVGATHRVEPHTYGVSFFSSRGPTGDGRVKPDLVAPGEKIIGPLPGERYARMDGTSMAAPHVSGAAAMLIARHRELIGQPESVKQTLCKSATDLGREPYFQGAGMLDILRAMQSL
jgi:subtilisin family serine protease